MEQGIIALAPVRVREQEKAARIALGSGPPAWIRLLRGRDQLSSFSHFLDSAFHFSPSLHFAFWSTTVVPEPETDRMLFDTEAREGAAKLKTSAAVVNAIAEAFICFLTLYRPTAGFIRRGLVAT